MQFTLTLNASLYFSSSSSVNSLGTDFCLLVLNSTLLTGEVILEMKFAQLLHLNNVILLSYQNNYNSFQVHWKITYLQQLI